MVKFIVESIKTEIVGCELITVKYIIVKLRQDTTKKMKKYQAPFLSEIFQKLLFCCLFIQSGVINLFRKCLYVWIDFVRRNSFYPPFLCSWTSITEELKTCPYWHQLEWTISIELIEKLLSVWPTAKHVLATLHFLPEKTKQWICWNGGGGGSENINICVTLFVSAPIMRLLIANVSSQL